MTDKPHFETDEVSATRGREQGLGVGARELAAQRDAGGVVTPDEDDDEDAVERNTAVQGDPEEDAATPGT